VDCDHTPLDHGHLGVSNLRRLSRCTLGLLGAGLGRLLGVGSSRERLADALVDRHRLSAFGHDARKTRHDEDLECVAYFFHLHANRFWHAAHSKWSGEFGTCVRAIFDWDLVRDLSWDYVFSVSFLLCEESRSFAQRK